jgi:DNA-binding PadR family transcriptional regulator
MLTQRDFALLSSLEAARYLTAQAIEWLHWPSWQERWQHWRAACSSEHHLPYKASTSLYTRLKRLEQQGLVYRIRRPVSVAATQVRRDQDAYALSEQGAHVLAEYAGRDVTTLAYRAPRARSTLLLAHQVDVGKVYAAVRAKVEATAGLQLADWRGEAALAKAYDRLNVRTTNVDGSTTIRTLPVQPDGTFRLLHAGGEERCFVEVDRGRPTVTWRDKIHAYHAYMNSPELYKRYNTATFILLTVTTDATQRRKLMEATAQVLGKPSGRYLFALDQAVHPASIGQQWLRITQVQTQAQHVPGSRSVPGVTIETAEHIFIH